MDLNFQDKVVLLKFYPEQDPSILDYYVKKKYKGIVLEVFGLGQISVNPKTWLKKMILWCFKSGLYI